MKSIIVYFLVIFSLSLHAKDKLKANVKCINEEFIFTIDSNSLELSDDALIDNTGGYVDIFANKYYLKTKSKLYYMDGIVSKNHKNGINRFKSNIKNNNGKFIDQKALYELKDQDSIKFIQKIDLEKNNNINRIKNITTTNILNINFDKSSVEKEYKKCK